MLFFASLLIAAAPVPVTLQEYLPKPGVIVARVMQPLAPAEIERISQKVTSAARADPAWFRAHVAANPTTGNLPYHPRLGVTAAEYSLLLAGLKRIELRQVATLEITVKSAPNGSLVLIPAQASSPLAGIVLHPGADFVDAGQGRLNSRSTINQADPLSPTGRWSGVQWRSTIKPDGAVAKIAFGRREAGDNIIYYDSKEPAQGQSISLILLYPAAK